jgi:hypothetical protein
MGQVTECVLSGMSLIVCRHPIAQPLVMWSVLSSLNARQLALKKRLKKMEALMERSKRKLKTAAGVRKKMQRKSDAVATPLALLERKLRRL